LLQQFYLASIRDCLLGSAPSPNPVKQNSLKGNERHCKGAI